MVCSTKLCGLAHFQGTQCLVNDKYLGKCVNSDGFATNGTVKNIRAIKYYC
jgi:hypothetical protein